jgi:CHASE1-domain containing sensor protein
LAVFAVSWGLLAAPRATIALHGAPDVLFRIIWFGLGLAAAVVLVAEAV